MANEVTTPELAHLSLIVGSPLRDRAGGRLGRLDDLIVRLGSPGYPPITGLLARVAGRQTYVPIELVTQLQHGDVIVGVPKLDLRPFERRPEEVLLKKDVLDRQLINVDGARLIRANEIELARIGGWWRVVGVDTGVRGALRRLLPRRLAQLIKLRTFLDWSSVEPFVGHVPTVRLRIPHPRLAKLHPADIADLVEAASHAEGEEIIAAVGEDRELEADVFEELDERHQVEFLAERSDDQAARVLSRMSTDDAADLLGELPQERRDQLIALLPPADGVKVRVLMGYDPTTAGGLMSTEYLCLYAHTTVLEARKQIKHAELPEDVTTAVFVMGPRHRLEGAVSLLRLLCADGDVTLGVLAQPVQMLKPDDDLEEVARVMTDYNLTMAPVVDDSERMIGVVTVDDALEVLVPRSWRRRHGLFSED